MRQKRTFIPCLALGAGAAAACASLAPADNVPTLSTLVAAMNAEKYRGRVIRTCAPIYEQYFKSSPDVWGLTQPAATAHHPATILVIPCPGSRPVPTQAGKCITGRVAARNGTLVPPQHGARGFSSSPISSPWYLHEQCPPPRR